MEEITNDRFAEWYLLDLDIEKTVKLKKGKDLLKELSTPEELKEKKRKPKELPDFLTYKLQDLRKTIEQINKEINSRFELKKDFERELDYQITQAALSQEKFKFWGLGYNTGVDVKRNLLERQLADFRKEKRRTELQCWDDITSLRKELREAVEEYKTLLRRKNSLE